MTVKVPPSTTAGVESLRFTVSTLESARTVTVRQAPNSGPVGSTLDVHGSGGIPLAATITRIVDPAAGTSEYVKPRPGSRFVAIFETLADIAPPPSLDDHGTLSVSPYTATSIVGADFHHYAPYGAPVQGCTDTITNAEGFTFYGGESRSACVVFELPTGVDVAQARFSLSLGGVEAEWNT